MQRSRQRFAAAGLYGTRINIFEGRPDDTGLSNYFANLVVSESMLTSGQLPATAIELGRYAAARHAKGEAHRSNRRHALVRERRRNQRCPPWVEQRPQVLDRHRAVREAAVEVRTVRRNRWRQCGLRAERADWMLREAVLGMLPKNKLRARRAKKLRIYLDDKGLARHAGQKPQPLAS